MIYDYTTGIKHRWLVITEGLWIPVEHDLALLGTWSKAGEPKSLSPKKAGLGRKSIGFRSIEACWLKIWLCRKSLNISKHGVPHNSIIRQRHHATRGTIWSFNIAMENSLFIDGLPKLNMVIFHGYVSHNQMVSISPFADTPFFSAVSVLHHL